MSAGEGILGPVATLGRIYSADDLVCVPLHRLRLGHVISYPVHDESGVLLLAQGSEITERFVELLRLRQVASVLVHAQETAVHFEISPMGYGKRAATPPPGEIVPLRTAVSRRLDEELAGQLSHNWFTAEQPLVPTIPDRGVEPYDEWFARTVVREHEQSVNRLRSTANAIIDGGQGGEKTARKIVVDYLRIVLQDLDLAGCLAGAPTHGDYPYRHSLHVALLSLAMGIRAQLSATQLEALGLGAVLHDLGMLQVPGRAWQKPGALASEERHMLRQHPIFTVDALEGLPGITDPTRFVCYQMHERTAGMGYPRQVPGSLIHPLAKIAGLADTYVALVSKRPYRPAMLPYLAMETILDLAKLGYFDRETVRLLLVTLSLYPLGSYVRLNDGRVAKVMRTGGEQYAQPVVQIWEKRGASSFEPSEMIDLRFGGGLAVAEAIETFHQAA